MPTLQDAIALVLAEMPEASQDLALRYADVVVREMCAFFPELCRDVVVLPLTAGVAEYDLAPNTTQIEGATFTLDGTTIPLRDESIESIRSLDRGFRAAAPADWMEADRGVAMYVGSRTVGAARKLSVGFAPPPNADMAAGTLNLYVSLAPATAATISTPLLAGLSTIQPYIDGILYYLARVYRPGSALAYQEAYRDSRTLAGTLARTMEEGLKDPTEKNSRAR